MTEGKLEVVVFTHDHEAFVERTLASVLSQTTDFEISIRIHDDASTDGTVAAVRRALEHTDVDWSLYEAPTNRYAEGTAFYHEFIAASGAQYAAVLDGDDFWIDDTKLQRQVEALDAAPSAALCHHTVLEFAGGELRPVDWPPADFRQSIIPGSRLSVHNVVSSSAVVVRTSMFPKVMPAGYNGLGVGDYPMWALASAGHDIAFIDRAMTAYRVHDTNIYASLASSTRLDRELEARIYISNNVPEEFRATWRKGIVDAVRYDFDDELRATKALLEQRTAELSAARQETLSILNSTSWRITAPLRAVIARLRRRPVAGTGRAN